ncbi:MAG: 50S ribosomal protein L11 methyltransferase [Synergistaceae bacterium]|nr:50S ribosomal protein L11 methyltransferase [Synergistaceae bacterium]
MGNAGGNFWWSVELESGGKAAEETLATIADLSGSIGAELFQEEGMTVLRAAYFSSHDISHWIAVLNELLADFPEARVRSHTKIENRDWHTKHLEAFPPLSVGVNFVVMAPWHKGKEPKGKLALYIYPSSAFGTGYHESTQIALSLIERFVKAGDEVVDVGTGSGVLFIAALKLGAAKTAARDVDPTAIAECRRNMELNGLASKACDLRIGDLVEGVETRFDVLTANILLEPNLKLLNDIGRVLKREGVAIFSGMTVSERTRFLSALSEADLSLVAELTTNDWWGCAAKFA